MKSAFAYLRVSGKGQVKGHGFGRQLEAIKGFAKKDRLKIEAVYREQGISGTADETQRAAFSQMVQEMLSNGVRTVIVESLDRLAREFRIQEHLLLYLASKGISLISANTGEDVTAAIQDDPMKKALVQIQGVFSELDKSLLVRKLSKAREQKRKAQGKCEGRKRFGEVDEEEKKVRRRILRMRRPEKGTNTRLSYAAIAERLNSEGIRTRMGKEWSGTQVYRICTAK